MKMVIIIVGFLITLVTSETMKMDFKTLAKINKLRDSAEELFVHTRDILDFSNDDLRVYKAYVRLINKRSLYLELTLDMWNRCGYDYTPSRYFKDAYQEVYKIMRHIRKFNAEEAIYGKKFSLKEKLHRAKALHKEILDISYTLSHEGVFRYLHSYESFDSSYFEEGVPSLL